MVVNDITTQSGTEKPTFHRDVQLLYYPKLFSFSHSNPPELFVSLSHSTVHEFRVSWWPKTSFIQLFFPCPKLWWFTNQHYCTDDTVGVATAITKLEDWSEWLHHVTTVQYW